MTTHMHLVQRLKMRRTTPLINLYDFMAWTRTNLLELLLKILSNSKAK